ncbi:hypothetical protein BH18ACT4_BH18ACT4_00890 [soil metagenome]
MTESADLAASAASALGVVRMGPERLELRYAIRVREEPQTADEFLTTITDLVRFRISTPKEDYERNVTAVASGMVQMGYALCEIRNFWQRSRYRTLNLVMTTPEGSSMEVEFPTPESYNASVDLNPNYEVLSANIAPPSLRVEAFAMILQGNLDADLTTPATMALPNPLDQSPRAFFERFSGLAHSYVIGLRQSELSVGEHLTEFGFSDEVVSVLARAIRGASEGGPVPGQGGMIYYEVTSRLRRAPSNLFIVAPSAGPTRAARLDHPTKTWTCDPLTVESTLTWDFDERQDRISIVDRSRAEAVADLLGSPLPTESQLDELMEDVAPASS